MRLQKIEKFTKIDERESINGQVRDCNAAIAFYQERNPLFVVTWDSVWIQVSDYVFVLMDIRANFGGLYKICRISTSVDATFIRLTAHYIIKVYPKKI